MSNPVHERFSKRVKNSERLKKFRLKKSLDSKSCVEQGLCFHNVDPKLGIGGGAIDTAVDVSAIFRVEQLSQGMPCGAVLNDCVHLSVYVT